MTALTVLARYGATDTVLARPEFRRPIPASVVPPCITPGHSYGLRLDCALAHLQDVHAWMPKSLVAYARSLGVGDPA